MEVLVLAEPPFDSQWFDDLEDKARSAQRNYLAKTGGINVVTITKEVIYRRRLINNLAWTTRKEGIPVMASDKLGYSGNCEDQECQRQEKLQDSSNP